MGRYRILVLAVSLAMTLSNGGAEPARAKTTLPPSNPKSPTVRDLSADSNGVTLTLEDADISAVIKTISEITGKNFVVDPRVKGKVTIISSRALDKNAIYEVFLSVLGVHGFAAIQDGNVIKIIPDANAKQSAIPMLNDEPASYGGAVVTRVIEVKNVQAAQLVPILRPLVAQQGHLAALPQNNVLILSDRADNVRRMLEIIQRIDISSRNEIEIIALQHASATEVVRVLTALNQQEKTKEGGNAPGAGGGMTFVADERTNTILLGGDKENRLRMRVIISHLDTPLENTGGNTRVVYLRYAQAKDLVSVLTGVNKGTDTISSRRSPSSSGNQPQQSVSSSGNGGAFKDVSIEAHEATNSLIITAPPDQMRNLLAVIRQLDIRRAQVLVEAIIAEVSATRANELGVQWAVDGYGTGGPVGVVNFPRSSGGGIADAIAGAAAGGAAQAAAISSVLGTGVNLALGDLSGSFRFAALVRALTSDGSTNILSTPNLVTLDNQEAEIVVGTNVPFITGSYSSSSSGLSNLTDNSVSGTSSYVSNPFQTIQRQDVGLTLKVKPQINEGNSVKLEIQQEVSALTTPPQGISTSDVVTSKRSIKTTVLVDDGQVIVLGGLIDDQVQENKNKVPFFGDIPLLGALFRSQSNNVNKRNLMIFLHPIILRDGAIMSEVSGAKYSYMRDRQVEAMNIGNRPREPQLTLPPLGLLERKEGMTGTMASTSQPTPTPLPALVLELPPPFEDDETAPERFFENLPPPEVAPDVRP